MIFVVVFIDMYIVVCGFAHVELQGRVDLQNCCVSGALHLLTVLRVDTVS